MSRYPFVRCLLYRSTPGSLASMPRRLNDRVFSRDTAHPAVHVIALASDTTNISNITACRLHITPRPYPYHGALKAEGCHGAFRRRAARRPLKPAKMPRFFRQPPTRPMPAAVTPTLTFASSSFEAGLPTALTRSRIPHNADSIHHHNRREEAEECWRLMHVEDIRH